MKIAFITHAIGVGGASISSSTVIQYLIDNGRIRAEDCIIVQENPGVESTEKNDIYFQLKKTVRWYDWKLPFSCVIKGAPKGIRFRLLCLKKNVEAIVFFLFFYSRILKGEQITHVHLNSFILWPLLPVIPKSIRKIIHIREIPRGGLFSDLAVRLTKHYATRIISIDPVSNSTFADDPKSIVIYNPINMTRSRELRKKRKELRSNWGIQEETTVISLVGRIEENKGFEFFINIVENTVPVRNLLFLVLGDHSGEYARKCVARLKKYDNVRFLGVYNDTSEFYAITDLVIRCENFFPLGRTVWEAIFAGAVALIPINAGEDYSMVKELVGRYIFLYKASDLADFSDKLQHILSMHPNMQSNSGYPVVNNVSTSANQFFHVLTF